MSSVSKTMIQSNFRFQYPCNYHDIKYGIIDITYPKCFKNNEQMMDRIGYESNIPQSHDFTIGVMDGHNRAEEQFIHLYKKNDLGEFYKEINALILLNEFDKTATELANGRAITYEKHLMFLITRYLAKFGIKFQDVHSTVIYATNNNHISKQ